MSATRHRHQEFLRFLRTINRQTPKGLDLHLIVDNYGTHTHYEVTDWLAKHPRFHMHFTPTSASWLNLVERWFREITEKQIRRGVFRSVEALVAAIMEYLDANNARPKAFIWTASTQTILPKVRQANEALETLHRANKPISYPWFTEDHLRVLGVCLQRTPEVADMYPEVLMDMAVRLCRLIHPV